MHCAPNAGGARGGQVAAGILGAMGAWLGVAFRLEFKGEPVWLQLLAASCALFAAHVALFVALVLRNA